MSIWTVAARSLQEWSDNLCWTISLLPPRMTPGCSTGLHSDLSPSQVWEPCHPTLGLEAGESCPGPSDTLLM